ncbi:BZ3500_MvSof-1268-A1-R1_Chr8-1g09826 [Microbotryum saponariae]|uniref:BZ3500_MvSof-1268-A1-R1_Chr8-1g09826 protein n=1 Tax=Microbotryum saponariae TaxID=289078 RepID=A0A2X0LA83_9BASI|nr:BZ3500_MvSof-1268-A1-R1_Chr8-1g09826 [Microbotryum saponariae]SDA08112.1 BZ3501_MvSof-1269-A2-R1_Chr8-1g09549 [Microbotryum saponariae]
MIRPTSTLRFGASSCLGSARAAARSPGAAPLLRAPRQRRPIRTFIALTATASTLAIGYALQQSTDEPLYARSSGPERGYESQSQLHRGKLGNISPSVFLWGRNEHNVASPQTPESDMVKRPKLAAQFKGAVLRDLVLAETYGGASQITQFGAMICKFILFLFALVHAAAVDEKGDVLQWGSGFDSSPVATATPRPTLRGYDVLKLTATPHKIFALTRKGEVIVFPSSSERQQINEEQRRSNSSWWKVWGSTDHGTDHEKIMPEQALAKGEKFVSLSAGESHLLALTSTGRSFGLPLDLSANVFGQLGVRNVQLLSLHSTSVSSGAVRVKLNPDPTLNEVRRELPAPPTRIDPLLLPPGATELPVIASQPIAPVSRPRRTESDVRLHDDESTQQAMEKDIRFSTVLHELPALREIEIAELVAGARHSLARLSDGRVLGWGANGYGQLGLGSSLSYPSIPAPTEIPLTRCYPKAVRVSCNRIAAGGNLSYFIVDAVDIPTMRQTIDLLATGNGQFGGIGNGSWAHQASPVKVKTISGLLEWSEETGKVAPIAIKDISVGNAHIALVLDNAVDQGGVKFGSDVFVWGHNMYHQLGTGKRSNLSTPQHLPPLPYAGLIAPPTRTIASVEGATATEQQPETERTMGSGTLSPMPHSRMQLAPEIRVGKKVVEEAIVAGDGGSAVYWRILNP